MNTSRDEKKPWTPEEDAIFAKYYPTEGSAVYKRLPERTRKACKDRAEKLGILVDRAHLAKTRPNHWTEEEDNILLTHFPTQGKKCFYMLPKRTEESCYKRAETLGLTSNNHLLSKFGAWTKEEDDILREYYPKEGLDAFKRVPNRTESGCRSRVRDLHLISLKSRDGAWSPEEETILMTYYPEEGSGCFRRLPHRTTNACYLRVKKLGIKYIGKGSRI